MNYGVENWDELTDILVKRDRFFDIGELNRAQMLDDAFSLARAGLVPYRVPLKMVRLLAHEPDFVPFKAGVSAISYLDKVNLIAVSDRKHLAHFLAADVKEERQAGLCQLQVLHEVPAERQVRDLVSEVRLVGKILSSHFFRFDQQGFLVNPKRDGSLDIKVSEVTVSG